MKLFSPSSMLIVLKQPLMPKCEMQVVSYQVGLTDRGRPTLLSSQPDVVVVVAVVFAPKELDWATGNTSIEGFIRSRSKPALRSGTPAADNEPTVTEAVESASRTYGNAVITLPELPSDALPVLSTIMPIDDHGAAPEPSPSELPEVLHLAANGDMMYTITSLLACGADPNIVNKDGLMPANCSTNNAISICLQSAIEGYDPGLK
jgi:hypothetical protein